MANASNNQIARWGKVHAWWLLHPMINADRFCILSALASYADERGLCHPSQATLARHLKRSRPWVNRIVRELTEVGLILKTSRTRSGNAGTTSCEYRLVDQRDAAGPDGTPVTVVTEAVHDMDSPCHPGDTNQHTTKHTIHARHATTNLDSDGAPEATEPTGVPAEWTPSDETTARAKALCPGMDLEAHAVMFASRSRSKGYRYTAGRIDDAWLSWLAEDRFKQGARDDGGRSAGRDGGTRDAGERRFMAWAAAASTPRVDQERDERSARDNPWK